MSDANSAPKPLLKTFGAALLGTFVGAMLYGCLCLLVYRYFREYRKDRRWFKYMVAFSWLVDTLHTIFSVHYCYYYLVSRFEQPEVRASAIWSLLTANLLTIFPPLISNLFYLSRLWKIGQRNWFIIGGLLFLITARFALETAIQILGYMHPVFSDLLRFHYYVKAYCSVSSVVDTLLAFLIVQRLRDASKAAFPHGRAARIVDLIVVYLLSAGVLTGIVCMASLFASVFLTGGLIDVTLHAILGKLYLISVLAVLNSRNPHVDEARDRFLQVSTFGVDNSTVTSEKVGLTAPASTLNSGYEFKNLQEKDYRGAVASSTYRFEDNIPMTPGTPGFGTRITSPPESPNLYPSFQVQQAQRASSFLNHADPASARNSFTPRAF